MSIVKKWASCATSFLGGFLALVMSLASGMVACMSIPALGMKEESVTKAMKVLTDGKLAKQAKAYGIDGEFGLMKGFSVVLTVVAILLLAYAVLKLLQNLNVLKINNRILSIAGIVVGGLFLVATVGVFASSLGYAGAMEDALTKMLTAQTGGAAEFSASVKLGVYQPVMLLVGALTAIVVCVFEVLKLKNK